MDAYYADEFVLPLPEGHRFPMAKYRLLRDRIAEELPETRLHVAPTAEDEELARVHLPEYIAAIAQGTLAPAAQREIGFPWSEAMARFEPGLVLYLAGADPMWVTGLAALP
jgi:acetoin utilization deacetylase AcuC-like enzyme